MMAFLFRRLLRAALLLAGVSVLSFCLFELTPGDYFDELRSNPAVSSETLAALRRQHGVDEAAGRRYMRWLVSVLRGDWGYSVAYHGPAAPLLFARARNTVILTAAAVFCAWVIAVPLAMWTVNGGQWRRRLADSFMSVLLAMPHLLILLVLMFAASQWRVLPAGGMTSLEFGQMSFWNRAGDLLSHLAVPGAALMLAALPAVFLHTRAALAEALNAPFIQFARANGIRGWRLLMRHALPAAANPLVTLMGLSAGTLLSAGLAVEAVAGWPGLGQLLLRSILQRDSVVVTGAVMLSAMVLLAGNLLADVLLYASNPRMREER
jgi:ABC-type dipeptide/oligopeptide/nickel transport system permease component